MALNSELFGNEIFAKRRSFYADDSSFAKLDKLIDERKNDAEKRYGKDFISAIGKLTKDELRILISNYDNMISYYEDNYIKSSNVKIPDSRNKIPVVDKTDVKIPVKTEVKTEVKTFVKTPVKTDVKTPVKPNNNNVNNDIFSQKKSKPLPKPNPVEKTRDSKIKELNEFQTDIFEKILFPYQDDYYIDRHYTKFIANGVKAPQPNAAFKNQYNKSEFAQAIPSSALYSQALPKLCKAFFQMEYCKDLAIIYTDTQGNLDYANWFSYYDNFAEELKKKFVELLEKSVYDPDRRKQNGKGILKPAKNITDPRFNNNNYVPEKKNKKSTKRVSFKEDMQYYPVEEVYIPDINDIDNYFADEDTVFFDTVDNKTPVRKSEIAQGVLYY